MTARFDLKNLDAYESKIQFKGTDVQIGCVLRILENSMLCFQTSSIVSFQFSFLFFIFHFYFNVNFFLLESSSVNNYNGFTCQKY